MSDLHNKINTLREAVGKKIIGQKELIQNLKWV